MELPSDDGVSVDDRRRALKRLAIATLAMPLVVLLVVSLTLTWDDVEPGAASTGWRVAAAIAWPIGMWGYVALALLVRRIPFGAFAGPRTAVQFLAAVAWWSAFYLLSFITFGYSLTRVAVEVVPCAVFNAAGLAFFMRRRASKGTFGATTPS